MDLRPVPDEGNHGVDIGAFEFFEKYSGRLSFITGVPQQNADFLALTKTPEFLEDLSSARDDIIKILIATQSNPYDTNQLHNYTAPISASLEGLRNANPDDAELNRVYATVEVLNGATRSIHHEHDNHPNRLRESPQHMELLRRLQERGAIGETMVDGNEVQRPLTDEEWSATVSDLGLCRTIFTASPNRIGLLPNGWKLANDEPIESDLAFRALSILQVTDGKTLSSASDQFADIRGITFTAILENNQDVLTYTKNILSAIIEHHEIHDVHLDALIEFIEVAYQQLGGALTIEGLRDLIDRRVAAEGVPENRVMTFDPGTVILHFLGDTELASVRFDEQGNPVSLTYHEQGIVDGKESPEQGVAGIGTHPISWLEGNADAQ